MVAIIASILSRFVRTDEQFNPDRTILTLYLSDHVEIEEEETDSERVAIKSGEEKYGEMYGASVVIGMENACKSKQRHNRCFPARLSLFDFDNSYQNRIQPILSAWETLTLQRAEENGGGKWESNPSVGFGPHNAFEEHEAHQLPFYLRIQNKC